MTKKTKIPKKAKGRFSDRSDRPTSARGWDPEQARMDKIAHDHVVEAQWKPRKSVRQTPRKADFDDEDQVLAEIARVLDIDRDELDIRRGSPPNGYGEAYMISIHGGHKEWIVMRDDDEFDAAAVEGVKNDLQESPENFESNFIRHHIDMDRLRRDLSSDLSNSNSDYVSDLDPERFWKEASDRGLDIPDDVQAAIDNGDDPREPTDAEEDEFAEDMTDEQLKDPIGYLEEIYGREEAQAKAAEIGGIDLDAAAEEAVRTDGAAHFMCSGDYSTSPSGFIYWRAN